VCENGKLVGMLSIGDLAVKENEQRAGETLQDVSEGVKHDGGSRRGDGRTSKASGRQTVQRRGTESRSDASRNTRSAGRDRVEDREERLRAQGGREEGGRSRSGEDRLNRGTARIQEGRDQARGRERQQGISARSRDKEDRRQSKVAPRREVASTGARTGRKRAS
jgi:hypothetical protein